MAQPLMSHAEWEQVHTTAIALGSIRAAAQAHGIGEDACYQRARRDHWLVGSKDRTEQAREERRMQAASHGIEVVRRVRVSESAGAESLDSYIQANGHTTRAMLSQALVHASAQARRTKHPLDRARQIKDVASAAAQVHGWDQGGDLTLVQIDVGVG